MHACYLLRVQLGPVWCMRLRLCSACAACDAGRVIAARRQKLDALTDEIHEKFRALEEEYR